MYDAIDSLASVPVALRQYLGTAEDLDGSLNDLLSRFLERLHLGREVNRDLVKSVPVGHDRQIRDVRELLGVRLPPRIDPRRLGVGHSTRSDDGGRIRQTSNLRNSTVRRDYSRSCWIGGVSEAGRVAGNTSSLRSGKVRYIADMCETYKVARV
ncbi:hypothetical protein BDZ89DRAFT_1045828 [Hymenopellis radicata]|nr:hypothetical protein BDZ89DRAFT_1045828 [Hymenopellis radicata]